MKQFTFLFVVVVGTTLTTFAQNKGDAVLGEWLSARKNGQILIYRQSGKYFGKITGGSGGPTKDEKNPDPALRNRNLVGLVILNDFFYDGDNTYKDGTIYDPREGKTYACKMTLEADRLTIRGYVGLSLFGRSEVWSRINGPKNQ